MSVVTVDAVKFFYKCNRFVVGFATACIMLSVFVACLDRWAIGKTTQEIEEELYRTIFEVDSLMLTIDTLLNGVKNE